MPIFVKASISSPFQHGQENNLKNDLQTFKQSLNLPILKRSMHNLVAPQHFIFSQEHLRLSAAGRPIKAHR